MRLPTIAIVELARGNLATGSWATTLARLARRGATGQLTIATPDRKRYAIAFEGGAIVGARSPLVADGVARVARTHAFATAAQIDELERRLAMMPARDEIDVLAALVRMPPPRVLELRRVLIARAAARTFSLDAGEYIFEDRSCLPVFGIELDARAVIFEGLRMHASEARLDRELRELGGTHVVLEPGAPDELYRYGFSDGEWPILAALREGVTIAELAARHREIDPRTMQAAILALAACGTARVLAVGRTPTPPNLPRTKTNPELAAEAAERGERALELDRPEAAVLELEQAVRLAPDDADYRALLGWALFCAADDKRAVAARTRELLERAVEDSRRPHLARFYLGRVARMLGRDREALGHFHAVLLLQPHHRDASAEIRVLQARLRRATFS